MTWSKSKGSGLKIANFAHPIPTIYNQPMHPHRLSKTQYLKGRQCIRRVWLYNWHRELMQPPSAVQEAIFQQGHEVGELAHQLFPGGVLITEDYKNPGGALESTQRALASGATAPNRKLWDKSTNFLSQLI